ncbi:MAG: hypothetical protein ACYCPW_08430, partial [Nitrososphaerales archaeon]
IFKPAPIVLGAKMDSGIVNPLQSSGMPSYGYRKLQPEIMLKLFKEISEESNTSNSLDQILGSLSPVAPKQGESYAEGPVVFTNKKILGSSQNQLDDKMSSEIRKLLRESYPGYG